ncbi:hypothetical protein [Chromobacterium alticapitis]|uniref:Uncharacterized protein n=1 Tax=Chromobacterium alticapitis TaxID=2073169 RepID=A0A2S5DA85_9NEIS|nr:hypothetical protein [Chromobacterium alticapitis]POZ59954.1 hypothetical protein C2I19_21455 [Chromobacterium alticapitis]
MLDQLQSEDFLPLIGQSCRFQSQQQPEVELRIQSVRQKPLSQVPGWETTQRTPFVVELVAGDTASLLVDAVGRLQLPATADLPERVLDNVWISRTGAMGRDRSYCYFQLPFN